MSLLTIQEAINKDFDTLIYKLNQDVKTLNRASQLYQKTVSKIKFK